MTTLTIPALPIPEETIQGVGSYTIPVNKYAFLSANASASAAGSYKNDDSAPGASGGSGSASSSNNVMWLIAGDTISTATVGASDITGGNNSFATASGYGAIKINGSTVIRSNATGKAGTSGTASARTAEVSGSSSIGWSVALFPIPKNNLPHELIEGN